jgi:outer membrane lipoprotein-sorting protein
MRAQLAASAALLLMGSILGPPCAPAAERLLQGEERSRLLEGLEQRQHAVTSLRATVRQRKRQPLLRAEVQSEGTLIFQRPDRLRWEVTTPEHTIFVIKGSMLLVYRPARREAERRDLRGDFGSQAALEFLNAGVSLSVAELEKRFQVDVYRDDSELTLRLTPLSRWVAQAITSIVISQADGDPIPWKIVVVGRRGDRTATTLTDIVVNPQLPEDPFTLRLGADVRVREARDPGGDGGSDR